MNRIHQLVQQLQETDSISASFDRLAKNIPLDEIAQINAEAVKKRRIDLENRLNDALRLSQADLVQYHVSRDHTERYPATAVARAILNFQELITSVFDAIRSTPKQRYRPAPENVELSTLDFAMALPVGSVLVSMSVENERLLAVRSDLDLTFDRVFKLLRTKDAEQLRSLAEVVGIASISKAHDWAQSAAEFGLNTTIQVHKDFETQIDFALSNVEALHLKQVIEEKSDQDISTEYVTGELVGIDVAHPNTYFHIKTVDGRNLEGKLAETFDVSRPWSVHVMYQATVQRVTIVRYATGEERTEWRLAALAFLPELPKAPRALRKVVRRLRKKKAM